MVIFHDLPSLRCGLLKIKSKLLMDVISISTYGCYMTPTTFWEVNVQNTY